jgi:PAS domain S-box-containing protein
MERAPLAARSAVEGELRSELFPTKDYLRSVIEQTKAHTEELTAANEEIASSNEELRCTNEELQMAKEELQATNEELLTVNEELSVRNVEAVCLGDDLQNVLTSVEIPILLLGRDLRIRRFTPAAARLLALVAANVGSALAAIDGVLARQMGRAAASVLQQLTAVHETLQDETGHWYHVDVRPYLTADGRVDGVVVSALDVDEAKRGTERIAAARIYAESIVDTVREGLLILDQDLRIRSANRSYCRMFGVTPQEVQGQLLRNAGCGQWNVPALEQRLAALAEHGNFEDCRIEHDFHGLGHRVLVLNGRRIRDMPFVLLAIEDVTEMARAAIRQKQLELHEMLTSAAEAIVMVDADGHIVFANRATGELFGYELDELAQLSVEALVPESLREVSVGDRASRTAAPNVRQMGRKREVSGRRKGGTEFPILVSLSAITQDGRPLYVAFIEDITERSRAEEEIRQYQEKLRQMAFDAALAEERERRRIAIDLHDHIGQSLALARIRLVAAHEELEGVPRQRVEEAVKLLGQSMEHTRTLTFELAPPILYDLGLKDALSWLVEDVQARTSVRVELEAAAAAFPLDDAKAALLLRAARELLMNVFKHAGAQTARLVLDRCGDRMRLQVEDAGAGFDVDEALARGPGAGFGLFSVREQIGRLGGTLDVESTRGVGTCITICLPLETATLANGTDGRANADGL